MLALHFSAFDIKVSIITIINNILINQLCFHLLYTKEKILFGNSWFFFNHRSAVYKVTMHLLMSLQNKHPANVIIISLIKKQLKLNRIAFGE